MKLHRLFLSVALALAIAPALVYAADSGDTDSLLQVPPALAAALADIHPEHGKIDIGSHLATLDMPEDLGYLPPDQANILLHTAMGYPKMKTLGIIVPTTIPLGAPASWAAIITYREDGHVSDSDAANLDAGILLARMQQENGLRRAKLREKGFSRVGVDILGWATQPRYDSTRHAAIWAVETREIGGKDYTVDYHIDILGRQGVLSIHAASSLDQLPMIEGNDQKISSLVEFPPSTRYVDFNPDTDRKAAYGVGDLIAGHTPSATAGSVHKDAPDAARLRGIWLPLFSLLMASALLWKLLRRRNR
jgi:uncharacterized membrane-anchored protein